MNIFYDSPERFTKRIVKNWIKSGVRHNAGNIQILKFAWVAKRYWSNRKGEKVSKLNYEDTYQLRLY